MPLGRNTKYAQIGNRYFTPEIVGGKYQISETTSGDILARLGDRASGPTGQALIDSLTGPDNLIAKLTPQDLQGLELETGPGGAVGLKSFGDFRSIGIPNQEIAKLFGFGATSAPNVPTPQFNLAGYLDIGGKERGTVQPGFQDATLTGQQTGGTFQGREFFRRGKDVFEKTATGERPISFDEFQTKLQGLNLDVLPQEQVSKFETGFQQANQALGDKAADVSGTQGTALVNQYSPQKTNDFSSLFIKQDEFINGLTTAFQEYIKPESQRVSLRETYTQMIKDSGIQALDLELVDMKSIIEGTEDDLRTEITKAGGFATESQIQALTNSRNKQLIKNYNRLVDTRNAKEKYLETSLQLEQADRESADQRFNNMFNMGVQLQQMQQQMQQNARNQMQWLATNVGFDGLFDSTGGDPYYMSLVEQTLGLPQGGLATAANQARLARTQAAEKAKLELEETKAGIALKGEQLKMAPLERDLKAEQIKTEVVQRQKLAADIQKLLNTPSGKPISSATALQIADSQASLDMLGELDSTIRDNQNLFGPIVGRFMAFNPYATETQAVQSIINSTKQIVGKFLEGGVLRKEDEAKYEKILPKLSDTSEVAMRKLANVRNLVELKIASQRDILEAAGYNPAIPPSDSNIIIGPDGLEYEITN